MRINTTILLILAIIIVIFTLQNAFGITISLLIWKIPDAPFALILLCSVLLGYLIAAFQLYPRVWALKKELRKTMDANDKATEKSKSGQSAEERPGVEGIDLDELDDEEDGGFFKE